MSGHLREELGEDRGAGRVIGGGGDEVDPHVRLRRKGFNYLGAEALVSGGVAG